MAKCNLVKKWKDAKATFKTAVGKKKPGAGTIKILTVVVRRGSGIEKALSNFDTAVNKGHRKDAALAYQAYWRIAGEYVPYLNEASSKLDPSDKEFDGLGKMAVALGDISQATESALRDLQSKKSGKVLEVHQFLADVEGQLKLLKSAIKKDKIATAAEKDYKLVTSAQTVVKPLKIYTVAAARGDAAKALGGLDDFIKASKTYQGNCKQVVNLIGTMSGYDKYVDAIRSFGKLCSEMERVRVASARQKLQKAIDED